MNIKTDSRGLSHLRDDEVVKALLTGVCMREHR